MRNVALLLALTLAAAPAVGQTALQGTPMQGTPMRGMHAPRTSHGMRAHPTAGSGNQRPIDNGPFTPEANRAYQGGGMVLQGAPGAPAPRPTPTPSGQTPRDMVPQ